MAVKVVVQIASQIRRQVIGDAHKPRQLPTDIEPRAICESGDWLDNDYGTVREVGSLRQANCIVVNDGRDAHARILVGFAGIVNRWKKNWRWEMGDRR